MATYIAKNKVVTKEIDKDIKTPNGGEIYLITYENGVKELMPKKTFDLFSTPGPVDFTSYRNLKHAQVASEILAIIADYDVTFSDLKNLLQIVVDSTNDNFDRVSNFLWTGDDNQFIPGTDSLERRTFSEVQKFLNKIPKQKVEENKDESKTDKKSE